MKVLHRQCGWSSNPKEDLQKTKRMLLVPFRFFDFRVENRLFPYVHMKEKKIKKLKISLGKKMPYSVYVFEFNACMNLN